MLGVAGCPRLAGAVAFYDHGAGWRWATRYRQKMTNQLDIYKGVNGSAMKGATMLATLENLRVVASFSRPRVSNDNPFAEALFRTCKYRPDYPRKAFASLEEARAWTLQFVRWYNHEHKHSGLKFVTPAQRHSGVATAVLAQREVVYAQAKARNPKRWSGSTRNWELKDEVWLNPERTPPAELKQCA